MSERTLGKARGLNSIADPADFKGSRGRRREKQPADGPPPPPRPEDHADARPGPEPSAGAGPDVIDLAHDQRLADHNDATVSPDPSASSGAFGSPIAADVRPGAVSPVISAVPAKPPTPHRAVVPGLQRKRRELSIPIPVADALTNTGINPADVVMSAYRRHSDAIFAGAGGRMMSRGRQRLRLSISDGEFDKLTRLGEARGWNRSETVAVLLTMDLLPPAEDGSSQ